MAEGKITFKVEAEAAISSAVLERGDLLVVAYNRPLTDEEFVDTQTNLQRLVDEWGVRVFVLEDSKVIGIKGPARDVNGARLDG